MIDETKHDTTMEDDARHQANESDREWLWDRWAEGEERGRMAEEEEE